MTPQPNDQAAWILATVGELRRNGSWTGRIHIHKHLFITRILNVAQSPFDDFQLYDYGPYSFELDDLVMELEMAGNLDRSYPKAGYGPQYRPTVRGDAQARKLSPDIQAAIQRVAKTLGCRKSQELELIATCLWVQRVEGIDDDEKVIERVKQLKPKYKDQGELIVQKLVDTKNIVGQLTPA